MSNKLSTVVLVLVLSLSELISTHDKKLNLVLSKKNFLKLYNIFNTNNYIYYNED